MACALLLAVIMHFARAPLCSASQLYLLMFNRKAAGHRTNAPVLQNKFGNCTVAVSKVFSKYLANYHPWHPTLRRHLAIVSKHLGSWMKAQHYLTVFLFKEQLCGLTQSLANFKKTEFDSFRNHSFTEMWSILIYDLFIESFELEEALKGHLVYPPCSVRDTYS